MKLGIIGTPKEESFWKAHERGLDFVELTINGGQDVKAFMEQLPQIRKWMNKYQLSIQSIGRWKAPILKEDGSIDEEEVKNAEQLIEAAAILQSPHYICGCNRVDALSLYENVGKAITFFSRVMDMADRKNVQVSTLTCYKMNFVDRPEMWSLIHGHLPGLGIKYDPAHAVARGADYLKEAAEWGHLFRHVHLKGALVVGGKRVDDPPVGMDQIEWKLFVSILRAHHYTGGLSLEPHSDIWVGDRFWDGVDYSIRFMNDLLGRETLSERNVAL